MQLHQGFAQGRLASGELIPVLRLNADRLPVPKQFFELFGFCAQQLVLAELVALPHLHQVPRREHPEAGTGGSCCALPNGAHQASTAQQRQLVLQQPALQRFAGHQGDRRFAQDRWQQQAQHPLAALPFANREEAVVRAPQAAGNQPSQRQPMGPPGASPAAQQLLELVVGLGFLHPPLWVAGS